MSYVQHRILNFVHGQENSSGMSTLIPPDLPPICTDCTLDPPFNQTGRRNNQEMSDSDEQLFSTYPDMAKGEDEKVAEPRQRDVPDSSHPLFSMYLEMSGDEDEKLAERWQKDAKPILFFVRTSVFFFSYSFTYQVNITDRFVLCGTCAIICRDGPRPQRKPAGNVQVLPRENI
jgi:hypothetical protein